MSFRAYCFSVPCAFVITDEIKSLLYEKVKDKVEDDDIFTLVDALEELGLSIQVNSDVEGDVIPFNERNDNTSYYLDSETLAYIECERYPSLYEAVYRSYDELLQEFKQHLKDWLPADFPIEKNLWTVLAVVYG